jgi:hypothetical protein
MKMDFGEYLIPQNDKITLEKLAYRDSMNTPHKIIPDSSFPSLCIVVILSSFASTPPLTGCQYPLRSGVLFNKRNCNEGESV